MYSVLYWILVEKTWMKRPVRYMCICMKLEPVFRAVFVYSVSHSVSCDRDFMRPIPYSVFCINHIPYSIMWFVTHSVFRILYHTFCIMWLIWDAFRTPYWYPYYVCRIMWFETDSVSVAVAVFRIMWFEYWDPFRIPYPYPYSVSCYLRPIPYTVIRIRIRILYHVIWDPFHIPYSISHSVSCDSGFCTLMWVPYYSVSVSVSVSCDSALWGVLRIPYPYPYQNVILHFEVGSVFCIPYPYHVILHFEVGSVSASVSIRPYHVILRFEVCI